MGCVTSKLITRTGSFKEETLHGYKRSIGGLEELLASKNSGDQFLALLCTANTASRKLNPADQPRQHEPEPELDDSTPPLEVVIHPTTINTDTEATINTNIGTNSTNIETINTWELLAGLEEDQNNTSSDYIDEKPTKSVVRSRSLHTVEEYDAMVARSNHLLEEGNHHGEGLIKECITDPDSSIKETAKGGSRRKAMAKELAALRVNPPAFEFNKSASLRDWLLQGGQVFSPGSYVTPKFGELIGRPSGAKDGDVAFDPEMVAHFEQAMEQLTMEEECVIGQILESLGGGISEEGVSTVSDTAVTIQM